MTNPHDGPNGKAGVDGEHEGERVVVRDRRRIDPVTGEVRVPAGEQLAGTPGPAPEAGTDVGESPKLAELEARVAERTDDLQRITAEYANYRRRVDRDREVVLAVARAQFVSELLTVLDDIERAQVHGDLNGPFKSVADKLVGVVAKLGLESFGAIGELFDPAQHEAVQHDMADAAERTVTVISAVLRPGYRLADRVLRPAMVTVVDRVADDAAAPDSAPAGSPAEPGVH